MKYVLILLVISASLTAIPACGKLMPKMLRPWPVQGESYGGSVKSLSGDSRTHIEYASIEHLIAEKRKEADTKMWTADKYESEIQLMKKKQPGGLITLKIERITIGAANTKYFSIIIEKDGERIMEQTGRDEIAERPSSGNDYWWNLELFPISQKVELPFKVYVIDQLGPKRFEFEVVSPTKQ